MSNVNTTASRIAVSTSPDWIRQLGRLWWYRQWLKTGGVCLFMWAFFSAYFQLLRHPAYPVTPMPLTPLDAWIGFQPEAVWPYLSLWFYVGIAPCLLPTLRALLGYGAWGTALCLSGLVCFYFWPTAVPPQVHALDPALMQHPGLALLRGVDAAGNACPSMHVAGAVFSAVWIDRVLRGVQAPTWPRALNLAWLLVIAWSTVAVRQHVVMDVVAGAALGALYGALSLRFGPAVYPSAPGQPLSLARHRH